MALIKADFKVEYVTFTYNDSGAVTDIAMSVDYAVQDDAVRNADGNPTQVSRVRVVKSILGEVAPGVTVVAAKTFGERIRALAQLV